MTVKSEKVTVYSVFLVFFLTTLSFNFSSASDGITYLNEFEASSNLFQPHHLLYHLLTYGWYRLLQLILPFVDNNYLIESINCFWGAGILTIFYLINRKTLLLSRLNSFIVTLLPAFSFGVWFYSTNIEVYVAPLFFIMAIIYQLSLKQLTNRSVNLIILFHVLAILFHQVSVLLIPVTMISLWFRRSEINYTRYLIKHTVIGGGIVLLVYFLIGSLVLGHSTEHDFLAWLRGYTSANEYWFPLSLNTMANAGIGLGRAFIGAHFVFKLNFVEAYMAKSFFYHNLHDEAYLVRNMSTTTATLLAAIAGIFGMIMLVVFAMTLKHMRILAKKSSALFLPVILTLVVYTTFFFFWMPQIVDFWIPQTVMVWMIITASWFNIPVLSEGLKRTTILLAAMLLLIVNFFGSIVWLRNLENDYYYSKVAEVNKLSSKNDLLLLQDGWLIKAYTKRFGKLTTISVPAKGSNEISVANLMIESAFNRGGKLIFVKDKSYFNAINNVSYIDSLLSLESNEVDSIKTTLNTIIIVERKSH